jgi:hypothetical protein
MAVHCEPAVKMTMPNSTPVSLAGRLVGPILRMSLIVLLAALVLACSGQPRRISGEPPAITLDSMMIEGSALRVRVLLGNVNDEALPLQTLQLELAMDGRPPLMSDPLSAGLTVAARGREQLEFTLPLSMPVRGLLAELSAGEVERLPIEMRLYQRTGTSQRPLTRGPGFVHAVPGLINRYR